MHEIFDDQMMDTTWKDRKRYMWKHLVFLLMDITVLSCSFTVYYYYRIDDDDGFIAKAQISHDLRVWLSVYTILYLVFLVRRLFLIFGTCCMRDPRNSRARINCLTFGILNSFECVWFIWGNTFFYTQIFDPYELQHQNLWKVMLAIIVYGFITLTLFIVSLLGMVVFFCALKQQGFLNSDDHK